MPKNTVLVVDDEPQNLAALKQILGDCHPLVFARSGADALAAAAKHAPSLILLDIDMPDMDGYAACRALKADPATASIPVIFITALPDADAEAAGFAAGAVDYIVKPVSPPVVKARVRTHLSLVNATVLERSYREAISMLGEAGHLNDTDTGAHVWRMAAYARALAGAIGWDESACQLLELAAPMHDTGKIGVPDAVLRKPGKLDADEWAIMQGHCRIGYEILSKSEAPVFRMAAEIALNHHEKFDGSGYPRGLSGEAIPESARIVALADVFDALATKRPYKEPWPIERITAHMREQAGRHFDPRLLEVFLGLMPQLLAIRASWNNSAGPGQPAAPASP